MDNQLQNEEQNIILPPVKYTAGEVTIRETIAQFKDLHIIPANQENYKEVMKAISTLRTIRTGIEKDRKTVTKKILEFKSQWDEEADRLTAIITPEENRLQAERKAEDQRKEEIRLAEEKKEYERVLAIRIKIQEIRNRVPREPKDSAFLQALYSEIEAEFLSKSVDFAELKSEADTAYADTMQTINLQLAARLKWEKEEEERKAEIARLEQLCKEREEEEKRLAAERARAEAEAKAKEEAERIRAQAEREKIEAERRAFEAEKAKSEAESKLREEESRRKLEEFRQQLKEREEALKREQEKIEAEKRAEEERKSMEIREAQEKIEREEFERQAKIRAEIEAKEKAEREERVRQDRLRLEDEERKRKESLMPDKEKLQVWIDQHIAIVDPDVKSKEAQVLLANSSFALDSVIQEIAGKIEKL